MLRSHRVASLFGSASIALAVCAAAAPAQTPHDSVIAKTQRATSDSIAKMVAPALAEVCDNRRPTAKQKIACPSYGRFFARFVSTESALVATVIVPPAPLPPPAPTPVIVPPTPAPAPTPTDSLAEPVFDPTKATMLYDENFDKYTVDSLRPPCGSPVGKTLVDHSIAYCTPGAGWTFDSNVGLTQGRTGQAVKMSYSGMISAGGQEIHGLIVGNPGGQTGRSATFVQYWMRFVSDSGQPLTSVDANGMSSATIAIKNVMLWNDQNRFQWDFINGAPCHNADGSPWYGPIGYTSITGIEAGYFGCQSAQPVGPSLAQYGDGNWHRWTIQYKPMSVPGATDGVARLWIDSKLVTNLEKGACAAPPPTPGWKPWCDVSELAGLVGGTTGVISIEWGGPRTDGGYTSKWTMVMDDVRWWKNN